MLGRKTYITAHQHAENGSGPQHAFFPW